MQISSTFISEKVVGLIVLTVASGFCSEVGGLGSLRLIKEKHPELSMAKTSGLGHWG